MNLIQLKRYSVVGISRDRNQNKSLVKTKNYDPNPESIDKKKFGAILQEQCAGSVLTTKTRTGSQIW